MSANYRGSYSANKETQTWESNAYVTPEKGSNKENTSRPSNVHFSDYKVTMNEFDKPGNKPGSGFKLSYMFNIHGSDFKPTQNIYEDDKQTVIQYYRDPRTQEPRGRKESHH
jgi:hypothetical protein